MLTDYDAKAIAEVMGIAFLRQEAPLAAKPVRVPKAGKDAFVIRDGDAVMIVEAKGRRAPAMFQAASPVLIEKAVARGLPRQALRHVAESLAGGDKAKATRLEWGVVPKTTLERRAQLSPEESERTERVARLFVHACRALGTEAEAREFMTTPHPALDGRSPAEAARSDLGTRRVERMLTALEYGLAL